MSKSTQIISLTGLSEKQSLVAVFETVKALGWRIRFTSDAGVIAYTDNGEYSWNGEITIKVDDDSAAVDCVSISTMPSDFGHCDNAVAQYVATFKKISTTLTEEEVDEKYAEYEKEFVPPYEDTLKPDIRPKFSQTNGFLSFFKPTENYFFTPIIVVINLLVFVIMVCAGISFFKPTGESMLNWGANATVLTLSGQWWRLLTNCFIHFGIIHLLLNMYALVFVGVLLEPFLGKVKFLTAYLLTGIVASLASLWWHDYTISAGASGAVFGLYGVFLAILTTNHIERSMRNGLLTNIGVFVVYNLVYGGLQQGIDNAAHIGGLLSGAAIGYLFLPALRRPDKNKLNNMVVAGTTALVIISSIVAYLALSNTDRVVYFKRMEGFYSLETKAVGVLTGQDTKTDNEKAAALKEGVKYWQEGAKLITQIDQLKLSPKIHQRNDLLLKYCQLRIQSFQLMSQAYANSAYVNEAAIMKVNQQVQQVMKQLSAR